MRNDDQVSKLDFQRKGVVGVHGLKPQAGGYLAQRTAAEQAEIFRRGLEEQRARAEAEAAAAATSSGNSLPAVHDDKIYRGYNPILRTYVRGRTHEREILRSRGLRHAI